MSKISVVVPVYKVEKYIHRCIDSILRQTFADYELILVDDGSSDNCGEICDLYSLEENRILVIHKNNGGLSDARNAGIEYALRYSDSEWITFIDSDDWVHPKYLEFLYQAAKETGHRMSVCAYRETDRETDMAEIDDCAVEMVDTEAFFCERHGNAIVAWGKLYRKELFLSLRYPVGKLHEDEFTTYKLLFGESVVTTIPDELYFYYYNPGGIMHTTWNCKRLDFIDAIYESALFLRKTKYQKSYAYILERVIYSIFDVYSHRLDILKSNPDSLKHLRRVLGKALRMGKKNFPFQENRYLFEIAYPKSVGLFWKLRTIKARLVRK